MGGNTTKISPAPTPTQPQLLEVADKAPENSPLGKYAARYVAPLSIGKWGCSLGKWVNPLAECSGCCRGRVESKWYLQQPLLPLAMSNGDRVTVYGVSSFPNWWVGECNGKVGIFHMDRVRPMTSSDSGYNELLEFRLREANGWILEPIVQIIASYVNLPTLYWPDHGSGFSWTIARVPGSMERSILFIPPPKAVDYSVAISALPELSIAPKRWGLRIDFEEDHVSGLRFGLSRNEPDNPVLSGVIVDEVDSDDAGVITLIPPNSVAIEEMPSPFPSGTIFDCTIKEKNEIRISSPQGGPERILRATNISWKYVYLFVIVTCKPNTKATLSFLEPHQFLTKK